MTATVNPNGAPPIGPQRLAELGGYADRLDSLAVEVHQVVHALQVRGIEPPGEQRPAGTLFEWAAWLRRQA